MLCTGSSDAAAANVIAVLWDPALRTDLLGYLQDYLPTPHSTKLDDIIRTRLIALRSRPDVASAIAAVGHINSYPFPTPSW